MSDPIITAAPPWHRQSDTPLEPGVVSDAVAERIRADERKRIAAKLRAEIPLYVGMTIEHPGTWLWGFADKIERGEL